MDPRTGADFHYLPEGLELPLLSYKWGVKSAVAPRTPLLWAASREQSTITVQVRESERLFAPLSYEVGSYPDEKILNDLATATDMDPDEPKVLRFVSW